MVDENLAKRISENKYHNMNGIRNDSINAQICHLFVCFQSHHMSKRWVGSRQIVIPEYSTGGWPLHTGLSIFVNFVTKTHLHWLTCKRSLYIVLEHHLVLAISSSRLFRFKCSVFFKTECVLFSLTCGQCKSSALKNHLITQKRNFHLLLYRILATSHILQVRSVVDGWYVGKRQKQ